MRLLLVITLLWAQCYAQIVQVDSMRDLMDFFKDSGSQTLAVFDIDMTLIQPEEPAFQMVNIHKHSHVAKRVIFALPKEKRDIFFGLTTLGSSSVLIDEHTPHYLQDLRDRGILTIALTAALTGPLAHIEMMEEWKREELLALGIDFSSSFFDVERLNLYEMPNYRGNHVAYYRGILFTNGASRSKGEVLVRFLQKNQLHPQEIIFADDKEDHVKNIEAALLAYDPSIKYTGVHFLGAMRYPTPHLTEEEFSKRWDEVAAHAEILN